MKYAKKMIVVPFVQGAIQNASEAHVAYLDKEMSDILNSNKLNTDEKFKLYSQALAKFKNNFDTTALSTSQEISSISNKMS